MTKLFKKLIAKYVSVASENHLILKDSVNIYLPGRDIEMLTYGMIELIHQNRYQEAKMIARLIWNDLTFQEFCEAVTMGQNKRDKTSKEEFENWLKNENQQRDPPTDEEIPF